MQVDPVAGFLRLADTIQARDRRPRNVALQRAVDQHPAAFADYCRAMGR
jgi:hypothetical protein